MPIKEIYYSQLCSNKKSEVSDYRLQKSTQAITTIYGNMYHLCPGDSIAPKESNEFMDFHSFAKIKIAHRLTFGNIY